MPVYEYRCGSCGALFEKIVFGAASKILCEQCGSPNTEKLLSRFGLGRSSTEGQGSAASSSCSGCSSSSCAGCK
ncbi:MAG TPA: zinc ribbon domain-containing protein [Nitrospirota bacterium]|nr:zinc ribbon domain-containing protein [Nitrospirota bacterium]